MVTVILLIVAVLLLLYAAYELIARSFRLELNVRPPRGKPHVFTTKMPQAFRRPGNDARLEQPVRDAGVPASSDARSPAASADRDIDLAASIPADLPTRTIRVRPAWRTSALWFGLLALGLALVGQHNLSPASGPPSDADVGAGLRWYGLAIIVLLLGWQGSYVNRSLLRVRTGFTARLGQWTRAAGLAALALILNIGGTLLLRADWSSAPGGLLWAGSLGLLVLAFAIAPRLPAPPREARPGSEETFAWRLPRAVEVGAVLAIMAVAVTMRVWRLNEFAIGMHGDEGEAGTEALKILNGQLVSPFTSGWFNQPNVYYWSIALCMKLFGTGLFGLRSFAVLCGLVTVVFLYLIAREMFGQRAALIAGFFIAFQSGDLIFSRQEFSNVTTPTFMTVAFYFLLRGLRTQRHLDFVFAGCGAGFALYYFAGGRLVGPVAAVVLAYLALRHRAFLPNYWTHVGAFVLALSAISSPFVAFFVVDHPIPANVYPNDRFIWLHYADLAQQYNATGWPAILWGQLTRTLAIITHAVDVSAMDALDYPVARPLEAVLIILGLAWAAWRWRDTRFALMSIWFWSSIIAGGVLTIGAPNLPRILGMLPVLPLAIASILDHLATQIAVVAGTLGRRPQGRWAGQWVGGAVAGGAIVFCGVQNWQMLIDHYIAEYRNVYVTAQAAYVHHTGLNYRYYDLASPVFYWGHGDNRFINPNADGIDVTNVSHVLPIIDNGPLGEKDTIFLVWAQMYQSLPVLQAFYPEGSRETVRLGDAAHPAQPLIAYIITHQQIDRHRVLRVRYAPRGGQAVERMAPAIGLAGATAPPAALRYPVQATWDGGLVAPADDAYRFQLNAPVGTRVMIDGRDVFPARVPAGRPATAVVVLTQGPHAVHLAAILTDQRTRVELQWAHGAGPVAPIARRYLWDNHVTRR